jgi:hypothetical protein
MQPLANMDCSEEAQPLQTHQTNNFKRSCITNETAQMKRLPEVGGVHESSFQVNFGHGAVQIVLQLVANAK